MEYNFLNPHQHLQENYLHQLKETINAYNSTQIVLGEALQNAIDAIVQANDSISHQINITLNLDQSTITIYDTGIGFPNDPRLLFLGGGTKHSKKSKKLFGAIGAGIKVVLFSSTEFRLRATSDEGSFCCELSDAHNFDKDPPPDLGSDKQFPDDPSPLNCGTEVCYQFPNSTEGNPIRKFIRDMYNQCLPDGNDKKFGKTLISAVEKNIYENRFAGLMSTFLCRYTYAGDVLNRLGSKVELSDTTIYVNVICSNPLQLFGDQIGNLFDNKTQFSFEINPKYLLLSDTYKWGPKRIGSYEIPLGPGGTSVPQVANGFNTLCYNTPNAYEQLLTGTNGQLRSEVKKSIEEYRKDLFPKINGIYLTIARIPQFDAFLPGGSQRVISANGVSTIHQVNLTRGRNQQYIRCFDLVVDVNARLNYGKSQLTDNHLVNRIRRFIDDAYATTIQTAASRWVGIINQNDNEHDIFLKRKKLNVPQLASKRVPKDENDVIALFFELLGRDILKGYQSFGLSQKERYDGRFVIKQSGDEEELEEPQDDRQLSTVEFKTEVDKLFREFEQGIKNPSDLELIIAWKEGSLNSNRFYLEDIEYSKYQPNKIYHGVKSYLHDTLSGAEIQVLLLKSVIDSIRENKGRDE